MESYCISGVRVCAEKLWRCGQDLGRARQALSDMAAAAHQLVEPMRQRAQHLMTKLLLFHLVLSIYCQTQVFHLFELDGG